MASLLAQHLPWLELFYASYNGTFIDEELNIGMFYNFDIATNTYSQVSTSTTSSVNDRARCVYAAEDW